MNTAARSSRYQPLHYPDGSNLRDREGRLWMPLGPGAHYVRQGQVGEPALSFQDLATQHGPMVKEIKGG